MSQLQQIWDLDFEVPIIQAPMAGVQDSALAIAVSNSGAIGSLPCAMLSPEGVQSELEKLSAATNKPYNINFFCHSPPVHDEAQEARWLELLQPFYTELEIAAATTAKKSPARAPFSNAIADIVEPFRPPIVSFHFGLPEPALLDRVKAWGSRILASATTVAEARYLEDGGVDAVIAQGIEAGGHRGMFLNDDLSQQVGLQQLLPGIIEQTDLPVIAAGGIANAQQVKDCIASGAAGVQIGTSYLCATEATTSALHRQLLLQESKLETAITNLYTGRPARGLVNRLMNELGPMHEAAPEFPLAAFAIAPLRNKSVELGLPDFLPLWSGTNQSGCRECDAEEITRTLASELS